MYVLPSSLFASAFIQKSFDCCFWLISMSLNYLFFSASLRHKLTFHFIHCHLVEGGRWRCFFRILFPLFLYFSFSVTHCLRLFSEENATWIDRETLSGSWLTLSFLLYSTFTAGYNVSYLKSKNVQSSTHKKTAICVYVGSILGEMGNQAEIYKI